MRTLLLTLWIAGCEADKEPPPDTGSTPVDSGRDSGEEAHEDSRGHTGDSAPEDGPDADGDGFPAFSDCDDHDASRYPGADEICDDLDNDCDERINDGLFTDADEDGYGGAAVGESCAEGSSVSHADGDCDDEEPAVNPGEREACDDLDNDCDGEINDDLYVDLDGDGYGTAPVGASCAGTPVADEDGDCDDADPTANPGETESCDGVDNDCDGVAEDHLYPDIDLDGYGDWSTISCTAGVPTSPDASDCDDSDPAINPRAKEVCDGVDNDCNLDIDDLPPFVDLDEDEVGGARRGLGCMATLHYVEVGGDCDDEDASATPGAEEVCDGVDNDCDGEGDEELAWIDADEDGYGETERAEACDPAVSYALEGGDCDDADRGVNPGECDACNGEDDDCDGEVDNGADATGGYVYDDADGDGYGSGGREWVWTCEIGYRQVTNQDDCDDTEAGVNPDIAEVCQDGVDNDCDGLMDCEDDDCAESDCAEVDCGDGVDGDRDGFTDCQDDDCWGTDCGYVVARVTGGSLSGQVTRTRENSSSHRQTTTVIDASGSVSGRVYAYSAAGARVATCDWAVGRTRLREVSTYRKDSDYFSFAIVGPGGAGVSPPPPSGTSDCSSPWDESDTSTSWGWGGSWDTSVRSDHDAGLSRDSVTVGAGCGVYGDDFLPRELLWEDGVGWRTEDGALWYGGAMSTTSVRTTWPGSYTSVRTRGVQLDLWSGETYAGPLDP